MAGMERFDLDCVVLGAGVVGLAVARALAEHYQHSDQQVWLVERHAGIGMETSSRNSEVIHAGIYYPPGSLKADLCVRGKKLLYQYCDSNSVATKRCGKLLIASNPAQAEKLELLAQNALRNGVEDLEPLDKKRIQQLEPELEAHSAYLSPSTGILDSHAYMLQLLADFESFGGHLVLNTEVRLRTLEDSAIELELLRQNTLLSVRQCVNACGLKAADLLAQAGGAKIAIPELHYAKGDYFSYSGTTPFSHLIYPMPADGGLGIHLTMDLQGRAKFGPDVTWLESPLDTDRINYQVDPKKHARFVEAVQGYWPGIIPENLHPDYSGIRPKLSGPGEAAADFEIQDQSSHGVEGLVNLYGFESPGLTASLAIGEAVVARLKGLAR